jgi:hypothetical protein
MFTIALAPFLFLYRSPFGALASSLPSYPCLLCLLLLMLMAKLLCWMMEATESDKDKNELRGKLVVWWRRRA